MADVKEPLLSESNRAHPYSQQPQEPVRIYAPNYVLNQNVPAYPAIAQQGVQPPQYQDVDPPPYLEPPADNYPPPDPYKDVAYVPIPPIKVETHYRLSQFLCVLSWVCLIVPTIVFSTCAFYYSRKSKKHLRNNEIPEARKKSKTAFRFSIAALIVAFIYYCVIAGTVYGFDYFITCCQ